MDDIFEAIGDAIHDFFVDVCGGMFIGIFDDANAAVGQIAAEVGKTPFKPFWASFKACRRQ